MRSSDVQHPFLVMSFPGGFAWCLHCEQASRAADWAANDWDCPVTGCDGGALDVQPWEEFSRIRPLFPDRPELGKVYGLYEGGI